MVCKYVYKKGKRKGLRCSNENIQGLEYCKHHNKTKIIEASNIIKKITIDLIKEKIDNLKTNDKNKNVILKHYYNMRRLESSSTEFYKNQIFVDLALNYPWSNTYNINDYLQKKYKTNKEFILDLKTSFDNKIYGLEHVKNEIINIICKFITNPDSNRNNILLCSPAGCGKTKFVQILSDVLNLPMKTISLGGIKDTSFFLGHGYVYVESGPGKIIHNVIDSKISNPILYFDELDKVSQSENGKDIYNFLCYLTDPTQNSKFSDHYFYGMEFDLSKVFYIFTCNDTSVIDRVLLDRLNVVNIEAPKQKDIIEILIRYCIPELVENIGIRKNINIDKKIVEYVVNTYENNDKYITSGVREYYRIFEKVFLEINKDILIGKYEHKKNIKLNIELFIEYLHKIENTIQKTNGLPLHMYS